MTPAARVLRRLRAEPERGSAIAEFVMVAGLLLFVALGVFQIGLALYVRNTLISAASEGARYAARADADPADGVTRTQALITSSLSARFAQQVGVAERTMPDGVRVVEITVEAPLPVVGPLGPSEALTVRGRAFSEEQVSPDGSAGAAPASTQGARR
ncbi:TadE family protein [Intrasporangium sp. YIM S08009]|uniref:TadE family protein n=1 Tax=Intrasporangium zincisolvens TaxID=3080018 RepID=UPI002B060B23|nr:TadE family protein [Intrasporangium sp. YIM S08009]